MLARPSARVVLVAVVFATACADPSSVLPTALPRISTLQAKDDPASCPKVPKGTTSVTLVPATTTVMVGATALLVVKNQSGVDVPTCAVTWSVTPDSSVASVAGTGVVSGVSVGGPVTVAVAVNDKGKTVLSATASVTVIPAAVATVTLTPATASLEINATQQLSAVLRDANGNVLTGRTITWSSSDATVATVSSGGLVTSVGLGSPATITATSEGVTATAVVTVTPVALSTLSLVLAFQSGGAGRVHSMRGDGAHLTYLNIGIGPSQVGNVLIARGGNFGDNTIYAMDATGGNRTQILGAGPSYSPHLSPDGSRYTLLYGDCGGGHVVATANASGGGLAVSGLCTTISPRWSPRDDRILYATSSGLYTAAIDFSDPQLVFAAQNIATAVWAANGTQIYLSAMLGTDTSYGLYRIDLDGTGLRSVASAAGVDHFVEDVSPRGDWLVFYRRVAGQIEVWAMTSTSRSATQLLANGAAPEGVRWIR